MILRRLTQHSTDDSSFLCPEVVVTDGAPSVVIEDLHSPFRLVVASSTEANLYIIGHCPRLKKKSTTIFPCFCHKFIDRNFVLLVLNGRRYKCAITNKKVAPGVLEHQVLTDGLTWVASDPSILSMITVAESEGCVVTLT